MYQLIKIKNIQLYYVIFVFSFMTCSGVSSQSIMGYNGLFRIPTANENRDREISFSVAHIDERISVIEHGSSPNIRTFISLNYLPFLEINLVLNNLVNSDSPEQANGDRQSSFKLLFTELGIFPNIAIGVYDALGSLEGGGIHSDFAYITATKNFEIYQTIQFELSLGLAKRIYHQEGLGLQGIFCGSALNILSSIKLYGEYDSQYFNFGTRIRIINHIILFGGFLEGKYFSGGAGVCIQL